MAWRGLRVSADRTHHVRAGVPAYVARFREVLSFHEPGLAAAVADDGAMHIDADGLPAYAARFDRTFGFYEGRAAVQVGDDWFHVRADGGAQSGLRFAWCGNYQGGRCVVRTRDGRYFHLGSDGTPAYHHRWRYVGDYRDGAAVVQGEDGRHTHIDDAGSIVHGRWFVDLDVFHKGYARARDEAGWTHIGWDGLPRYERRFAGVEPFYNEKTGLPVGVGFGIRDAATAARIAGIADAVVVGSRIIEEIEKSTANGDTSSACANVKALVADIRRGIDEVRS
jgi:hypothetical protein